MVVLGQQFPDAPQGRGYSFTVIRLRYATAWREERSLVRLGFLKLPPAARRRSVFLSC
jgi:hypothetical protein